MHPKVSRNICVYYSAKGVGMNIMLKDCEFDLLLTKTECHSCVSITSFT